MTYNPQEVEFGTLVDLFYSRHNSTTPNRAGNDVGTQYRSGIYYQDNEQKKVSSHCITVYPASIMCDTHAQVAAYNRAQLSGAKRAGIWVQAKQLFTLLLPTRCTAVVHSAAVSTYYARMP